MSRDSILAASILAGTTIGAGIFSLPYVFNKIGVFAGFFYLIFFACVYVTVYLMYASVLRTRSGRHDFSYFAELYLPKTVAKFASFAILAEAIFVLTIYLILAPTFISLIAEVEWFYAVFAFWLFGSIFVFASLLWQGMAELLGTLAIIFIIFVVVFLGGWSGDGLPIVKPLNIESFLLPFGPLLFSFAARVAISRMVDEERAARRARRPFSLRGAIIVGTFIPALVYFLFVLGILGLSSDVTPEALNGLTELPAPLIATFGVLGLITIWTSYFMIGANFREILIEDKKVRPLLASALVIFLPLGFYFAGLRDFLETLSFTGGVFLSLEGIFLVTIWRRAFPEHPWKKLSYPLYLVFSVALIYAVFDALVV
ncbi:MAG TPA: aromatic amino acid transport family protein [Candidatus Paceibacterota bacterium]|nr:aromatic amino acid transport family protein [Candidatus Paceibacterota bacterium]